MEDTDDSGTTNFLAESRAANMALIASHDERPAAHQGPTYLPRIHIYRDTYLSSL